MTVNCVFPHDQLPLSNKKHKMTHLRSVGASRESVAPHGPHLPSTGPDHRGGRGAHPWGPLGSRDPHSRCEPHCSPRGVQRPQGVGGRRRRVVDATGKPQHGGLGGHGGLAGVEGAPRRPAVEQQQKAPVELERGRERVRAIDILSVDGASTAAAYWR